MKLAKSVAEAMAEEIRVVRHRLLRKMDPNESYFLMVLRNDLLNVAQMNWLESLSNRYERGSHYLGRNLGIEDPNEAQEIANGMAADLRVLRNLSMELEREPVTAERLRRAEEMVAHYGGKLTLVDRGKIPEDIALN